MKRAMATAAIVLGACAPMSQLGFGGEHAGAEHDAAHWSYAGATGPEHWGELAEANLACAIGHQQSPVDLAHPVAAAAPAPHIDWRPARATSIVNNGHTVQVNLADAGGVTIEDRLYRLTQFHFHHLSEHVVGGYAYPMEAHFVHAADDGRLAVIGVFIEEGDALALMDALWNAAPAHEGEAALSAIVDARVFLPADRAAYRYQGSLTTPPCTEIVDWTVFAAPVSASAAQIETFARAFPDNARPAQPLHRRYVLSTR